MVPVCVYDRAHLWVWNAGPWAVMLHWGSSCVCDLWPLCVYQTVLCVTLGMATQVGSRKSRNTWSNRQICPWNMEWSRAKVNRVLPREHTGHSKHLLPTTQEETLHHHEHHQMANTEIRSIIFFAAKDGEALYSQQKQDWELTVAQITNSLLPNSDLKWRKWGKPIDHSRMTSIESLMIIQWKGEIDLRD